MSKLLGAALRQARQWKKLSQSDVAKHLEVSRAAVGQWEAGENAPATLNLIKLCKYLEIDVSAAMQGLAQHDMFAGVQAGPTPPFDKAGFDTLIAKMGTGNIDILRTTAEGQSDFRIYEEIVGSVARPAGLANTIGGIAIYVVGQNMAPRYNEGDLVFLTGSRTPSLNDYVLIRMQGGEQQGWADCCIRQLVGRGNSKISVRQPFADKSTHIESAKISSIERIFPWNEIIGA